MDYLKILVEFIVIFIFLYLLYYFFIIKKCKNNNGYVPVEVNLILIIHKIDYKKINLYQMVKVVSIVTVIVISLVVTIVSNSFSNSILSILIGTVMSLLIAIVSYRIIGNYYERKSKIFSKKTKSKEKE